MPAMRCHVPRWDTIGAGVTDLHIEPLDGRDHLRASKLVLERACAFDRAGVVAEEKLWGVDPSSPSAHPAVFGAWLGARGPDRPLAGVAAVSGDRVRVLAVDPAYRRRGVGTALLEASIAAARASGQTRLRTLDQPGNYLAPGIDVANVDTITWLERRGWAVTGAPRQNVVVDVRDNPQVTASRCEAASGAARARGYEVRRATREDDARITEAIAKEFGGTWPYEIARALRFRRGDRDEPAVHIALEGGELCGFAAHDGNNQGLGWFGPTGTWPAHRGKGLGEALLLACLVDVAVDHAQCEIAWIGPRPFYERVAGGIAKDRAFVVLAREL